jgi:uncharacterized protein YbcI
MNKEAAFSNLVRSFRKTHVGKGPDTIKTTFLGNWAICEMRGNLTPVEKFLAQSEEGRRSIRSARTEMIKEVYEVNDTSSIEELVSAKMIQLFADINIKEDWAMSIFVFDRPIDGKSSASDPTS